MKALGVDKPLIGVVHLAPLPGSPRYGGSMTTAVRRAREDATAYLKAGIHAILVENYGDAPFFAGPAPRETIAAMAAIARQVRDLGRFPLGINVLRSDAEAAMAIAAAAEADFIRVNVLAGTVLTDQGLITGRAAETLRLRAALGATVEVWADLLVKHARPLVAQEATEIARDLVERAHADALIVTGPRTGSPADPEMLRPLARTAARVPRIVGSGITAENLARYWSLADGFIVGSSLMQRGRAGGRVAPARVQTLVEARRRLRRRVRRDAGPRSKGSRSKG
ncbi:MAG: BtpA/SgcQ family protein [Candidatus Eisenbacteria sp.]|nr:BtpA/SgcQ family protein [Candidatus Eisenbacteria bacterium]